MGRYVMRTPIVLDERGRRKPPPAFLAALDEQGGQLTGLIYDDEHALIYGVEVGDPAPLLAVEGVAQE